MGVEACAQGALSRKGARRWLTLCQTKSERKDLGAFFKSIHGTLNHLLYRDKAWMGRFIEKPFEISVIGQGLYEDFQEL